MAEDIVYRRHIRVLDSIRMLPPLTFIKDRVGLLSVEIKQLQLFAVLVTLSVLAVMSVAPSLITQAEVITPPQICYFTQSPPQAESLSANANSECFEIPTDIALSALTEGNSTGALQILKSTQQKLSTLSSPDRQLVNTSNSLSSLQLSLSASIDAIEKGNTTGAANILTGNKQKFPPAGSLFN